MVGIDDKERFVEAILSLYESHELRKKFSDNSLKLVKKYSLNNILKDMEQIYLKYVEKTTWFERVTKC